MDAWHDLLPHPLGALKKMPFISFNDLQPSRYALSFVPNDNRRSYWMEVAFIALDSEKLGEKPEDSFHYDFGDNMFPRYKENKTTKSIYEDDSSDDDDNLEEQRGVELNRETFSSLRDTIPSSILEFIRKN